MVGFESDRNLPITGEQQELLTCRNLAGVRHASASQRENRPMVGDEDPRAPYKVYEGDELRGTYETRAEARRRQQQLESEQTNRPEPHRHVRIEDNSGVAAM
jgi:hypothetical protein